ncbi:MAG: class I SAM-dependent methyltransferase [Alphaproteobacteria bacterium]|nr:class I SAM-dependent methyltransferase [Alphaproteobacteria bacterium]
MAKSPSLEPSAWVVRFAPLVRPGGPVLDLAAGGGRHARLFLGRGHPVTAVDREVEGLADVGPCAEVVRADLEDGSPWPFPERRFAAIVVTNYLYRPLFARLLDAIEEGGLLIYETFAQGNEAWSRPRNPDHLLERGELLRLALSGHLSVVAFEEGLTPKPSVVQRLCAVASPEPVDLRPGPGDAIFTGGDNAL